MRIDLSNIWIIAAVSLALGWFLNGPDALAFAEAGRIPYYEYCLRVTARIGYTFFVLAYVARPMFQLFGVGKWLLAHRRYLGLATAIAMTIHFAFIVLHVQATGELPDPVTLVLGGTPFLLLWAMAFTSNRPARRRLGRNWNRLHRTGMHYLWVVFVYTFAGRLPEQPEYWGLVLVGVAAAGVRFAASRTVKRAT